MDFKNIAAGMLADKLGVDNAQVGGIMDKLIGGGDKMDVAGLLGNLKDQGLGDIASSWLGDDANQSISADQLKEAIGAEDITQAAAQLGTDENSLLGGLQAALPQLVDKASSGGKLLDSIGGLGSLGGMAKKFL
ncbi:YidB family protein [Litorimonas sp. WD9-15]|uniref:YidB family protein n=1 Tax=Litorimonas sp. WD9-15 TaxID=3418716 RepID=UPI003D08CD61